MPNWRNAVRRAGVGLTCHWRASTAASALDTGGRGQRGEWQHRVWARRLRGSDSDGWGANVRCGCMAAVGGPSMAVLDQGDF